MIPIGTAHDNEVAFLSYEEKEMIDGVLNDAKIVNLRKKGLGTKGGIDFNDNDDIAKLVRGNKGHRKTNIGSKTEEDFDRIENEFSASMESDFDDAESSSLSVKFHDEAQMYDRSDEKTADTVDEENDCEEKRLKAQDRINDLLGGIPERSQTLHQMKTKHHLDKQDSLSQNNTQEVAGLPKMAHTDSTQRKNIMDPPLTNEDGESVHEYDSEADPIVWDWTRLYGTADIHTVTWESKMLSELCHIVENLALEVSSQG
jgi:hypothetical protein